MISINSMTLPVLILGAGGHARVLIDALLASSALIAGIVDPDPMLAGATVLGVPVLGGDEIVCNYSPDEILLVNGLGSIRLPQRRQEVFERFSATGYSFAPVVHPSAVIAADVELAEGVQIMAGAVVQTGCHIGANAIVNTRASVDHDCVIGDHSHIAPGVTLSGGVTVGRSSHIGTGTTIIQGIGIGDSSLVGAGSLVLKDVPSGVTVVGAPARMINNCRC